MKKRVRTLMLMLALGLFLLPSGGQRASAASEELTGFRSIELDLSPLQGPEKVMDGNPGEYSLKPRARIAVGTYRPGEDGTVFWRVADPQHANDGKTPGFFVIQDAWFRDNRRVMINPRDPRSPGRWGHDWSGSKAQKWCRQMATELFTPLEQKLLIGVNKTDTTDTYLYHQNYDPATLTPEDKIFFPSLQEVNDYMCNHMISPELTYMNPYGSETHEWWTRSNPVGPDYSYAIMKNGNIIERFINTEFSPRMAANMDLSSVLMLSGDENAKSDKIGLHAIEDRQDTGYTSILWKLTLRDSSRNFRVTESSMVCGLEEELTFHYTGAVVSTPEKPEYISVILSDQTGEPAYYGKLQEVRTESGTVTWAIPESLTQGRYTVRIFNEQANPGWETDYSSGFCITALEVVETLHPVYVNAENFPDPKFLAEVQKLEGAEDGMLSTAERKRITGLNVGDLGIRDLTGVGCLEYLNYLNCRNNLLQSLDLSGNPRMETLFCNNNQLKELSLSSCGGLIRVDCSDNQLVCLDIRAGTSYYCNNNQRMVEDGTPLTAFPDLDPKRVSQIEGGNFDNGRVNFTQEVLTYYYEVCKDNRARFTMIRPDPDGMPIDAEHFPDDAFRSYLKGIPGGANGSFSQEELAAVKQMDCSYAGIRDFTGLGYFANLEHLDCGKNNLTALDLSGNPRLQLLDCAENQIMELNLTRNAALTELTCSRNRLTELDLTGNPALTTLDCCINDIRILDLTQNPNLEYLSCGYDGLAALKLGSKPRLQTLACEANKVRHLDLSGCPKLEKMSVSETNIACLDLPGSAVFTYCRVVSNSRAVPNGAVLADLIPDLNLSKTSGFSGGSFRDGKVFFDEGQNRMTYQYACSGDKLKTFTLLRAEGSYMERSDSGEKLQVLNQDSAPCTLILAAFDANGRMLRTELFTVPVGQLRSYDLPVGTRAYLVDQNGVPLAPAVK